MSKGFDGQFLMENMNFNLPPGGIIGIIGANGAGKTTLFQMIIGHGKPRTVAPFTWGIRSRLAYVDQSRTLDGRKRPSGRRLPGETTRSNWVNTW